MQGLMLSRIRQINEHTSLAALTLAATLLLLPGLGSPLAGDEAISYNRYRLFPWRDILSHYYDTNQHSLFILLSNVCMGIFGNNELAFRLPSFLAGALAVPLLYWISRNLGNSQGTSLVAAAFFVFSAPHISYSQDGRGYALTLFLALVLTLSAIRLAQNTSAPGWSLGLVVSGFCLVLAIPSNAFFLAAIGIYCLAACFYGKQRQSFKERLPVLSGFLILFLFVAFYFYMIGAGIRAGIKNHAYAGIDRALFSKTGALLISPWGPWFYVLVVAGLFSLKSRSAMILFPSVFITPVVLMLATGIGGFPRVYLYLLPFILMLSAQGLIKILEQSKNEALGFSLAAVFAFGLVFESGQYITNHYSSRRNATEASIADALQVLSYVQTEIRGNQLVVLPQPFEANVLNSYLADRIGDDMFKIMRGEKPDRIIFIGHRDAVPGKSLMGGYILGSPPNLPPEAIKPVKDIGHMRIYEFDKKISRFIPADYDPDYETRLEIPSSAMVELKVVDKAQALGRRALLVRKNVKEDYWANSVAVKTVDIKNRGAYILLVYARKYGQRSKVFLAAGNAPLTTGYLNPYFGEFMIPDSDINWQMVFTLSPIDAGRHELMEAMQLQDDVSYFDGIQMFICS